jgi:lipoprotein-anchoring transpeptidase ErfK/SrfK
MSVRHRAALGSLLTALLLVGAGSACGPPEDPAPIELRDQADRGPRDGPRAAPAEAGVVVRLAQPAAVHTEPTPDSTVVTTLEPSTPLGSPRVLLVLDERDGWLQVSLPIRPNGSSGWVRSEGLHHTTTSKRVEVDLERRMLTLFDGASVVESATVAVGAPTTPTPRGSFYVTDLVDTDTPGGPYGPFAFGISAHSDQLTEFAGGDGQVGIHGTDDPSSIGRAVSNGCIRLPNEVVTRLIDHVELGTPVLVR